MPTLTIPEHRLHLLLIRAAQDLGMRLLVGIVGTFATLVLLLPH